MDTDGQNNTHTETSSHYVHVHVVLSLHCAWLSQKTHSMASNFVYFSFNPTSTSDGNILESLPKLLSWAWEKMKLPTIMRKAPGKIKGRMMLLAAEHSAFM